MLKRIDHPIAKEIVSSKKFFGITVSTQLEFIGNLKHQEVSEKNRVLYFQFAFNCMLSRQFLNELNSIVEEEESFVERGRLSSDLARSIARIWFPDSDYTSFYKLEDIDDYIAKLYGSSCVENDDIVSPLIFKKSICSPIQVVSSAVSKRLGYEEEPTWLVCIDEAEFLPRELQQCINNIFRAESSNVVIKMATLPFHHLTTETLSPGINAESSGSDFSYRFIDMDEDSDDFINVTNNLCQTRLCKAFNTKELHDLTLEESIGRVGENNWIDYYGLEQNGKKCTYQDILKGIISQFSDEKRKQIPKQQNLRKQTYDKYAPIFFFREIFKKTKKLGGNYTPSWFIGSLSIRKISEGNPRRFIRIMNVLFEGARKSNLSFKEQHRLIYNFAKEEYLSLKSMPNYGPILHTFLTEIAKNLAVQVHGEELLFRGKSFKIKKSQFVNIKTLSEALKFAVAYLHLDVDQASLHNGINHNTRFCLSNYMAAYFWIPLRKGDFPTLPENLLGKSQMKQRTLPWIE